MTDPQSAREFDMIVYGASGYTGRLVAQYLARTYPNGSVRWAMAGRSAEKLAAVRDEIGAPAETPLVTADAADPASLSAMTARTKVVATTVGPFTLYGEPLVAACAQTGTHYVDLCGEPLWMHDMIGKYAGAAETSGARIVFSCGFDSIPSDLGVFILQEAAIARFGAPLAHVKCRVKAMKGTFSGGTAASLGATKAQIAENPALFDVLRNPFALTPGFAGPKQPSTSKPREDEDYGSWAGPFVMASINTKNVHRTNMLLDHRYGAAFLYEEMVLTGPGEPGKATAEYLANTDIVSQGDLKPGEGPSAEEREAGFYELAFLGFGPGGERLESIVTGDKDPGYGSTSKMLAETGLRVADPATSIKGGIWTPAAAMGQGLVDRLTERAGMTFTVNG